MDRKLGGKQKGQYMKCNASKCLWNEKNQCTKDQIAIDYENIYQWEKLISRRIICKSFSQRLIKGHIDVSRYPQR